MRLCAVSGCDKPTRKQGSPLCEMHYMRQYRKSPRGFLAPPLPRYNGGPCSIPDCAEQARYRGWCKMHYTRWRRHGDPLVKHKPRPLSGPDHPFWGGSEIGYDGVHTRLRSRGKPQVCEQCGATGPGRRYHWALDWEATHRDTGGPKARPPIQHGPQ